jgi:uroporphyrinogen-III synthase
VLTTAEGEDLVLRAALFSPDGALRVRTPRALPPTMATPRWTWRGVCSPRRRKALPRSSTAAERRRCARCWSCGRNPAMPRAWRRARWGCVLGAPLFAVEAVAWTVPDPQGCAGILAGQRQPVSPGRAGAGSANRAAGAGRGRETARAARDAGFAVAAVGEGGLAEVARHLAPGRYCACRAPIRCRWRCRRAWWWTRSRSMRRGPAPLGGGAGLLAQPCVVALHSGEAARHFAAECTRLGLARGQIALACLAPRIAAMAGSGWQAVEISAMRRDQPLLALAHQMCQNL